MAHETAKHLALFKVPDTDQMIVTGRGDLLTDHQHLEDLAWSDRVVPGPLAFQCSAHGSLRAGRLEDVEPRGATICWDEPQPKVAVGQSVAIYVDTMVVGGGVVGDGVEAGDGVGPAAVRDRS